MTRTFQLLQPNILAMKSWKRNGLGKKLASIQEFYGDPITLEKAGARCSLSRASAV
jgi:hypothetical protein